MIHGKRIMIVEDDPSDRALILRALQREFPSAQMILAHEPDEFYHHVRGEDFDVAVLDWHLGWNDGTSLMKVIKARCPGRPVIMYTAVAQQEEAVEAMKAGLDDFVLKSPSSVMRLPAVVRSVLEIAEHRRAAKETQDLAVISRLANEVANEIYQPLDALGNVLYLLSRTRGVQPIDRDELLRIAKELTDRIQNLANRTFAFGRYDPQPLSVALPGIVDDVLSSYGPRLDFARVRVTRKFDTKETIRVFPHEIRQLTSNLLSNAIEVLPRGGHIAVRVRSSCDWGDVSRHGIRLTVADNGPGMSLTVRQRLFEPFFTTKGQRGSGLGLWVGRGIVQKHQGVISVRTSTRPGRSGTCFSVFLPFEAAEKAEAA